MQLALAVMAVLASGSAAADRRCVIETAPAAPRSKAGKPACHRASAAVAAKIRAEVTKQYEPSHDDGKASVTFGCDGLGKTIREIIVETGSGHGGGLEMWRARRATDGAYDVRGITNAGASFTLVGGSTAAPDLELVRAALTATVKEVWPPPPPNTIGGFRGSGSSNDFHVLVRLTDDEGRVVERQYTGYAGNPDQDTYLGLGVAIEALAPITILPATTAAITDDDRALFAERFAASVPHFDDQLYWWVMERYVDLARFLGNRTTIAGLLTRLVVTEDDRSKVDARTDAIEALANITGWDARTPKASDEEVGKRYLAGCKR
jgi:hypothetical protein